MELKETKYEYTFATEIVEIELSEAWIDILKEMDRKEYNINHRETRRHFSIDAVNDKDEWILDEDDIPDDVVINELYEFQDKRIIEAVSTLTDKQQGFIKKIYCDRWTKAEFARENNISRSAVTQLNKASIKKIKKLLKTT